MEFASEMVVRATLAGQRVDGGADHAVAAGRSRPPHLRSWRDGWRHLRFLLLFSPRWLFLIPGAVLLALGLVLAVAVLPGPLALGGYTLDVNSLAVACAMMVIGFQSVLCALFTQVYASSEGFLPEDPRVSRLLAAWSLERGLWIGGLLGSGWCHWPAGVLARWHSASPGQADYVNSLRVVVPSVTALITSCQMILGTFFLSVLRIRRADQPLAAPVMTPVVTDAGRDQPGPAQEGSAEPEPAPAVSPQPAANEA